MTNPDRALDLALRLAANVAANVIVAAAYTAERVKNSKATKLAARLVDQCLGFNAAEAQRYLYEDALNRAEERVESLDPFYADGGPTEWLPGVTSLDQLKPAIETGHDMGCTFAAEMFPQHTKTSAPGTPKPPDVAGGPESDAIATPPCGGVGSGQPTRDEWARLLGHSSAVAEQPVSVGDTGPGAGGSTQRGSLLGCSQCVIPPWIIRYPDGTYRIQCERHGLVAKGRIEFTPQ